MPEGVLSVTVIGPSLGVADAYATAAFVMGEDGPSWVPGSCRTFTVLGGDRVLTTVDDAMRLPLAAAASGVR